MNDPKPRAALIHEARRLPFQQLAALLPRWRPFDNDAAETARRALAHHIDTAREPFPTWQDAWNDLTRATDRQAGFLRVPAGRCDECNGRRFSTRAITRGRPNGICTTCNGNGRSRPRNEVALHAATPEVAAAE